MTIKTFCDLCNKELKEQSDCYYFKLYKVIISHEFFGTKQICKSCYDKIDKFVNKLKK